MKILFFCILLTLTQSSLAQVLLVPDHQVSLEDYMNKCRTDGYLCTHNYFKVFLVNQESAAFNLLLENVDLNNEDYRNFFPQQIKKILNEENISIEQAHLLLKVINKYETLDKNSLLQEIKDEIKDLAIELERLPEERSDAESFLIFKKVISKRQYAQIRYKIKYARVMRITPYSVPSSVFDLTEQNLISGSCDNPDYSAFLKTHTNLHYVPFFNEECAGTAAFSSSSDFKWSDYQKPVLYTVLAAAAIMLLSQYELQIQY